MPPLIIPPPIMPRPIISGPIAGHALKPQHRLHGTGVDCCCATTEAVPATPLKTAARTAARRVILFIFMMRCSNGMVSASFLNAYA
jgi:hypothetical protein